MTAAGRAGRSGRRQLLAAAGVAATIALSVGAPTAAQADLTPTPSPSAGTSLPVTVTLRSVSPLAPQPGQTFTLSGLLKNDSVEPVTSLAARLEVSASHVGSRGEFDDYAATPDGPPPADAVPVPTATSTLSRTSLPPGARARFGVSVPVDDLHLTDNWQVYEVALVVTGTTPLGDITVGQLRTFLPWAVVGQTGTGSPTPVAWIWPLVDRPHRATSTPWTDDDLAASMRDGGRLSTLLAAGIAAETQQPPPAPRRIQRKHRRRPPPPRLPAVTPVPVTWAVDPMLVQDAQDMKSGYKVSTGGGTRTGTGRAAASAWLADLDAAVGRGSILGLPYADPDVVAAIRAGLTGDVQLASTLGQAQLSAFDRTPLPYSWPADGFADQRTLDTLFAAGVTTVVLDSDALPVVGGDESLTPAAHSIITTRDGTLDAVLVDHRLSAAIDAGAADPALGPLTSQRVLSELLMIQAERPGTPREIVLAPDRRWAPSAAFARRLLTGTGRVPWVTPVSLSQVVSAPVYDRVTRAAVSYPATARIQELRRSYLRSTIALKDRLEAFTDILLGDTRGRQYEYGLLRLLSSAWRSDPVGAAQARSRLSRALDDAMQQVRITTHGDSLVTLTGSSGTVPVTVANELDTPVRVTVVTRSDPHLEVTRGARVTRTIPAHAQQPFDVHVTARTRGVATLNVSLFTPRTAGESRRYSSAVALRVRSTAYGLEALIITGGATAVLFVGAAVRLGRRARAARRAARAGA